MPRYSFAPSGYSMGGGLGLGSAIYNSLNQGLSLANQFRDLENRNITDQFRVPAQAASYDALRNRSANQAVQQAAFGAELSQLLGTPVVPQAGLYSQGPGDVSQLGMALQGMNDVMVEGSGVSANEDPRQYRPQAGYPVGPYYMSQ